MMGGMTNRRQTLHYICTTCCKDKRTDEQPLPAIQRYRSARIDAIATLSKQLGKPLVILSGKYGLVDADQNIPWYDEILTTESLPHLMPIVCQQLVDLQISQLSFHAVAKEVPGMGPYHEVLEQACARQGIPLLVTSVADL